MKADELRGHLDGLVLAVLEERSLHGYGIIEALHLRSGGELEVPTGTVYPALYRLERSGLVASEWGTVIGRRRRVYTLTVAGRRALEQKRAGWRAFSGVITAVLQEAPR